MHDDQSLKTLLLSERSALGNQFINYRAEHITIATFVKSPDNAMPAVEHQHSDYGFTIPLTPIPFLLNEGAVYFGEVGCVYPVHSNSLHGFKYAASNISFEDITIDKVFFEQMLTEKSATGVSFQYIFRTSQELSLYISAFKKECMRGRDKDTRKLQHLTALISMELIELGLQPTTSTRRQISDYQRGVRFAAEYINRSYMENITLETLSSISGLSPNYFSHCFRKMFGESPFSYLKKLRVSKAQNLLAGTTLPISAIAASCGFRHACTLTAALCSETQETPSQYRQRITERRIREET